MPEPDEQNLIERARRDPQAFAELYDRYVDRIYAYVFRRTGEVVLAQDVTSATFEKALRHLQCNRGKLCQCSWERLSEGIFRSPRPTGQNSFSWARSSFSVGVISIGLLWDGTG